MGVVVQPLLELQEGEIQRTEQFEIGQGRKGLLVIRLIRSAEEIGKEGELAIMQLIKMRIITVPTAIAITVAMFGFSVADAWAYKNNFSGKKDNSTEQDDVKNNPKFSQEGTRSGGVGGVELIKCNDTVTNQSPLSSGHTKSDGDLSDRPLSPANCDHVF